MEAMKKKHRVLLVDDYPDVVESMVMLVKLFGHEVASARSGAEAIMVAKAFVPDVVILDIGLPDLSGMVVIEVLRKILPAPLYVAAFSGWGEKGDEEQALRAGFDRHLTKPAGSLKIKEVLASASLMY